MASSVRLGVRDVYGTSGLLNQTSVIQSFSSTADQNPNAEVLTGWFWNRYRQDRTTQFKVGNNYLTACGRWFSRTFLNQYGLHWRAVGKYSDELYSRLVNTVATNDVNVNEISYARFMSRDIRSDVLAPVSQIASTERITMLRQFLETIKRVARKLTMTNLPKSVSATIPVEKNC